MPAVRLARSAAALLFGPATSRTFAVRYWDGSVEPPAPGCEPRFTLVLRSPGSLRRMLLPPSELALAEAYVRGDFEVEGDMEAATATADTLRSRLTSARGVLALFPNLLLLPTDHAPARTVRRHPSLQQLGRRHSRRRDRAAVRSHYDVGNDFYALWLDHRMVYSCAYFAPGVEDIDAAQEAKLEHICRKLRLQPGERLLDIGCGWGGLIRYAAQRYGVRALGITLSEQQAALANERIRADGLEGRCRAEVRDYRELAEEAAFDKVVSVGMVEHVGQSQLPTYFRQAYRLTRPGGLFLNHGIALCGSEAAPEETRGWSRLLWRQGQFAEQYVFPDGELVPLAEAVRQAERCGFEARDVETLREHYALTLRHWLRRLEAARAEAEALVGEQTYRVWRLYLAGSAHAFSIGRLTVAQLLLAKPDRHGRVSLPPTRADLYVDGTSPPLIADRA
jgi:cyclopropane-fatty-acyl-phospholipid synthase